MAPKKTAPQFEVATINPDEFVQGGLPDNFVGRVADAFWTISNFNGHATNNNKNSPHYGDPIYKLVARLSFEPAEDSELDPFEQDYSAGDLRSHIPLTEDGEPAGATTEIFAQLAVSANQLEFEESDLEEIRGVLVGKVPGPGGRLREMSKGSNFDFFMQKAKLCGLDSMGGIRDLIGLYGQWDRIPRPAIKGLVIEEGKKGPGDVLVLTEMMDDPSAGKRAKPKAAAAATKTKTRAAAAEVEEEEEESGDDSDDAALSAQVEEAIVEALTEAKGTSLNQAAIPKVILAAFKGSSDLKPALDLWKSEGWRSDEERAWEFDADSGVLSI